MIDHFYNIGSIKSYTFIEGSSVSGDINSACFL